MNWLEKIVLSPFTALYGAAIWLRNKGYDKGWLKSVKFDAPVISIGNLSVGGTGKTPHTEYLIRLLKDQYALGVLSRGYRRKTSGYVEVMPQSTAKEVGDEPLLYKWKYPQVKMAVAEDRIIGIPMLLEDEQRVVLLDDAFQHRAVRPGISILLTEYDNLYTNDSILPQGRLREFRSGAKRADLIVVTKSPKNLIPTEKKKMMQQLQPLPYQYVFFSHLDYGQIYPLFAQHETVIPSATTALMLTGIANPSSMKEHLTEQFQQVYERNFDDHHHFTASDIESIINTYNNIEGNKKVIITTEKDATRLLPYRKEFIKNNIPLFCLPVSVNFDVEDKSRFHKAIYLYLEKTINSEQNANELTQQD